MAGRADGDRPQIPHDWAANVKAKGGRRSLKGAALVDKLISDLRDSRQSNNKGRLVSIELSAVSAAYILRQFTAHIPYKINLDPSQERLIEIGGINAPCAPSPPPAVDVPDSPGATADAEEFDLTASNLGVSSSLASNSSLNFFGRRTKSSNPSTDPPAAPSAKEAAAHGLIEEEVDPLEFVSALLTLQGVRKWKRAEGWSEATAAYRPPL